MGTGACFGATDIRKYGFTDSRSEGFTESRIYGLMEGRCESICPFSVYNGLSKILLLENKLVFILYFTRLIVSLQQKWFEIPISLRAIVLV